MNDDAIQLGAFMTEEQLSELCEATAMELAYNPGVSIDTLGKLLDSVALIRAAAPGHASISVLDLLGKALVAAKHNKQLQRPQHP